MKIHTLSLIILHMILVISSPKRKKYKQKHQINSSEGKMHNETTSVPFGCRENYEKKSKTIKFNIGNLENKNIHQLRLVEIFSLFIEMKLMI
jgi:hypothetical protein